MNLNKLFWEYKSFFIDAPLYDMIKAFLFILIMVELVIPNTSNIFSRYIIGFLTITIPLAIVIDSFFRCGIFKKPINRTEKEEDE